VKILKKDKNGNPESMSKLPQMAKQLEVSLYRNARSFSNYMDMNTLKQRLQQIALEVSKKANNRSSGRVDDRRFVQPPQQQQQSQNFQQSSGMRPDPNGANSPFTGGRIDTMNPSRNVSNSGDNMSTSAQGGFVRSGTPQGGSRNQNDPDWKVRIRHKQQRLLLLHHSAKCPHEDGRCQVTPHCADMKRLWRHMEGCKDNNCHVPHCFSSRAILSHYRKCKDAACPACGPVRDTVRKSKSGPTSRPNMQPVSTGPMMDGLRQTTSTPQPQQLQQSMMSSSQDPLTAPYSSGSGGSFQQHSQSGRSNMPPPNSTSSGMPYGAQQPPASNQSHYNLQSSVSKTQSQGTVQPLYRTNQQNPDGRGATSRPDHSSQNSATANGSANRSGGSVVNGGGSGNSDRNGSEWQKIRHKQQRLLLLRHASRCQHEAGKCPVTPHCASMKKLWEHIAHCKNQQCTVQHCLSSRYVLSHYRRCKDPRCPACGPVRDTIRKSHEREKSRQQQGPPGAHGSSFDNFSVPGSAPGSGSLNSRTSPLENYEPDLKRPKMEVSSMTNNGHVPPLDQSMSQQPPMAIPGQESSQPPAPVANELESKVGETPASAKSNAAAAKTEKNSGKSQVKDGSLLESFTVKQLHSHLKSLDRKTQLPATKLKSKCSDVLKSLQSHQHGWVFNNPVDPVELGLPDYFDIIKKPMDLGTIQKKVDNGQYHAIDDFAADVHLTFDNAMQYNEDGSVVYDMAKELKVKFEADLAKLLSDLEAEDEERRSNERACTLCGCEKLLFEPPVYFCNGMNCQSQRIRRNSHFYIAGNNQYFWCSSCYNELDEKIPIEMVDLTVMKKDLKKKKNDEVHEESWVQCDTCNRWVHQICGLFNTRQNKEHHSEYCCPKCLTKKGRTDPANEHKPGPKPPGAADLPRTILSEWLEQYITKKVAIKKRQLAEEKSQTEKISLEEATAYVESGGPVIIRQVTAMDRKLEVRELMKERYAHKNYPDEFPFRCKCLVVFQQIDGVDVLIFALYLFEHGEDNPPPNQRCVYISYLDSVHFMRPRKLRTFVYHELLIAYLDYARRKGFATAHIWACPPLKGDDYIFYAKPEDQKTPRDSRLRQWYIEMLVECQKRNICGKVTNMHDLYFANESLDATAVPYMEGDYFPGEAENIIKMIKDGSFKKSGKDGKKKKPKKNAKSKGSTGTRSGGVDEEALIASGMMDGIKDLKDLDRDQVMVKLGETILPMKDSFMVAFLNWTGAKEEDMVVPDEIEKARIEYAAKDEDNLVGSKRDAVGNLRDSLSTKDNDGVKIIDDDDEDLECEFLDNRQAFLNLCRGNHYQFDEIRRAKHTSMMVLWHLHNRDAPKFVQQCVACSREILSGKRYHCNTCPDYDLCQDCYKDPNTNRGACAHPLVPIEVEPDAEGARSGLTDVQRQQRQRNLMLHIQLIEHASRCNSKSCTSTNCRKMKNYLHHARVCKLKVQGGCRICKRIWTLLRIHAQKCKDNNCPIPQCTAIREKMRQLQKQQQAMDDRRRMEMNRHMRGGPGASGH